MKMIDFRLSRQGLPLCKADRSFFILFFRITALLFLFLFLSEKCMAEMRQTESLLVEGISTSPTDLVFGSETDGS